VLNSDYSPTIARVGSTRTTRPTRDRSQPDLRETEGRGVGRRAQHRQRLRRSCRSARGQWGEEPGFTPGEEGCGIRTPKNKVPRDGIDPKTRGFSIPCPRGVSVEEHWREAAWRAVRLRSSGYPSALSTRSRHRGYRRRVDFTGIPERGRNGVRHLVGGSHGRFSSFGPLDERPRGLDDPVNVSPDTGGRHGAAMNTHASELVMPAQGPVVHGEAGGLPDVEEHQAIVISYDPG